LRDYAQRVDRDAIERRDFPVGRRGYDQAAVDEHLRRVADEMERLRDRPASEPVAKVQQAASEMLARLDGVERELGTLLAALRAGGERLDEGLARLHEQAGELAAEAEPPEEDFAAAAPAPSPNGDAAGAGLIALNTALSGTPREETARCLAEHFALADPEALLDDVYERAGR
jgi:DivIVA domain-containing protein